MSRSHSTRHPANPFGFVSVSACLTVAFLAANALFATGAAAQRYHPLEVGAEWSYFSTLDGDMLMNITGERVVRGVTTRVRRQQEQTQTYENYWTEDTSGNLFLHGARNYDGTFALAYWPPIQMVSSPLYLGKTWVTTGIQTYDLDGGARDESRFDYPLRVYTEDVRTVPAGDFYSFGVGFDIGPDPRFLRNGRSFDLFGRELFDVPDLISDNASEWYAENVGLVITTVHVDEELGFKLVSYGLPTPVAQMTWGRLRRAFR